MKTLKFLLPVIALASPLVLQAQPQPPTPDDGPPGEFQRERGGPRKLPEEVRKRFEEAREKALKDPKLAELKEKAASANKAFFEAMKAKMTEIDPGLNEILEKAREERPRKWGDMDKGPKGDKPEGRKGDGPDKKGDRKDGHLGKLTEEERTKLMAARDKAKEDPTVQAAKKQLDEAKTPEERQTAMQSFRDAMHQAILKVDSSLEGVLEKMKRPGPPPAPEGKAPAPPGTEPMESMSQP